MEDSFEALGLEKSSDPFLQVKELDSELLDAIPGASYLSKADKSLTAIEGRVLRAATPALSLWGELQSCRNNKKDKADINRLITLAEAVVCGIGQASVETKFQRRLAVTSKILKDRKKAKAVLHQNDTVMDKEKKFLFGQAFTKKLVKRLSRGQKLKDTLGKFQRKGKTQFRGRGSYKGRGNFKGSRSSFEPQQQPFHQGPRGGGASRGGRGRGKKQSRYVPICMSEQKAVYISNKRKFWFNGRLCSKTVGKQFLTYMSDSQKHVVRDGLPTHLRSPKSRGEDTALCTELEGSDSGPLDFGHSTRESHKLGKSSSSGGSSPRAEVQQINLIQNRPGSARNVKHESDRTLPGIGPSVHKHSISQGQERWRRSPHLQSEKAQFLHRVPTLQVRKDPCSDRHNPKRGFHVQNRPVKRILDDPNTPNRPEMDEIPLERQDVSVPSMAFRLRSSPEMVHQTDETCNSVSKKTRNKECHLHGRPLGGRHRARSVSPSLLSHDRTSESVRICGQHREVHTQSHSNPGQLPGVHHKLSGDVPVSAVTEDPKNSTSLQGPHTEETCVRAGTKQGARSIGSDSKSGLSSPPPLPEAPDVSNLKPSEKSKTIQCKTATKSRMQTGALMVDKELKRLEWKIVYQHSTTRSSNDRDRRLKCRLGRDMPGHHNPRTMETSRKTTTHQRERTTRSLSCNKSVHQRKGDRPCPPKDGQHDNSKSDHEDGLNQVSKPVQPHGRSLEILPRQSDNANSRTPTRNTEHNGGQRVQNIQRLQQLEVEQRSIPDDNESIRPSRDRLVCRQNEPPTAKIRQLETGSNSPNNRRVLSEVEQHSRLRISSNLPDRQMLNQSETGTSILDHNYAYVARSTVVRNTTTDGSQRPHTVTSDEQPTHRTDRRVSSDGTSWCNDASRLESIRQSARNPALSSRARNLLQQKLSAGSKKTYQGPWKRWGCWCHQRSLDPISAPVEHVANYLAEEQLRIGYSALNTTRSAISAYHDKCDGRPVGQHELIKDIMESALKIKPPKPKYTSTWDVNLVLEYIRQLGPNASLDKKTLTLKITMLMSLVSVARGHELRVLHLTNMQTSRDKVTFHITEKTKTGLKIMEFHRYEWSEYLDVVACLEAYIVATQALRDTESKQTQLLISYTSPHNPVSTSTIARWLRSVMENAGIDTNKYKAHSTRSAATSKAKARGMSVQQIMQAANWSNARTFLRFYNKQIDPVLNSNSSESRFANSVLS